MTFFFFIVFVIGEIDDPEEFEYALFEEVQLGAEVVAHLSGKFGGCKFGAGGEKHSIAGIELGSVEKFLQGFGGEEFNQRAAEGFRGYAGAFVNDVGEALRAHGFGELDHIIVERAGFIGTTGGGDGADNAATFDDFIENAEAGAFPDIGNVGK